MNINLDNYEQVFSLYVDNELSAADRKRVESFLVEYPYLREELEILQQTVLSPDEFPFFDKSALLKPILSEAEEEKLLLHLDNELTKPAAIIFEKEIAADDLLKKEWQLLQKTKLDAADQLVYPNKAELYRKEEGRVVRMPLLRWAAAAVVVGFGIYMGASLVTSPTDTTNELATNTNANTTDPKKGSAEKVTNVNVAQKGNEAVTNESNNALNQQYASNEASTEYKKSTQVNSDSKKKEVNEVRPGKDEMIAVTQPVKDKKTNGRIVEDEPMNKYDQALPSNEIAALQPKKSNNAIELNEINQAPKVNRPIIDEEIRSTSSGYAQTASLNFEENDNSVFLMDEDNISRSKAGILLKKLKRNVERRANLKPGKSLRIAGFEFAVK